jgi:ATP-dependent RNA helicase RhlE
MELRRPFYMSFTNFSLSPRLLANIETAGYTVSTPIQKEAIPYALSGRDLLGLAQTGTGKTAAFALPILHRLMQKPSRAVRALIVAPTRELAEQIHETFEMLGKGTGVRSAAVYGGVGKRPQILKLRQGVDVLVACPGRLLDLMSEGSVSLSGVSILVLDEADRMFDMGFLPDIRRIMSRLPKEKQTMLFSATMPQEVRSLADGVLTNPEVVQIGLQAPASTVTHGIYPVRDDHKIKMLFAMIEGPASGRVLVFTRTKHRARKLARELEKEGHRVSSLRGDMTQSARQQAMQGFKGGRYDILVATDIAARGIDVSEISHVINFDMPDTADAYTHRIGRTGRAGLSGDAFTIAVQEDEAMVRDIEKTLRTRIERRRLDGFDYEGFEPESQFAASPAGRSSSNRSGGGRPPQGRSGGNRGGSGGSYRGNGNYRSDSGSRRDYSPGTGRRAS